MPADQQRSTFTTVAAHLHELGEHGGRPSQRGIRDDSFQLPCQLQGLADAKQAGVEFAGWAALRVREQAGVMAPWRQRTCRQRGRHTWEVIHMAA